MSPGFEKKTQILVERELLVLVKICEDTWWREWVETVVELGCARIFFANVFGISSPVLWKKGHVYSYFKTLDHRGVNF